MTKILHFIRFILVFNMPTKINDFITYAGAKYNSMHSKSRYTPLASKLTDLNDSITALDTAQKGTKSKPPTVSTSDRDKCFETAKKNIHIVGSSVQQMADDDPENAEITIKEAGFDVKKVSIRQKQTTKVEKGTEPNSAYVTGEGAGGHNFRMSTDNETWTILLGSRDSHKIVRGLTSGTVYYFQTSLALNDGEEGEWSDSVSIRID
ncbi:MAG: hypothetical protein WCH34_12235 [Bacteroidota bacterium]